jgi:thimet oligopeptidase
MQCFVRAGVALLFVFIPIQFAADLSATQHSIWIAKPDSEAFERNENRQLSQAQQLIEKLLAVHSPRTIENTLRPYDDAIRYLNSANYLASLVQSVHPDSAFRHRATAMVDKVSAAQTALSLKQSVYTALKSLEASSADSATKYYLHRQLLEFHLAGVDKSEAERARLRELNSRLTSQQSAFERNVSDGRNTITATAAELAGVPADYLEHHKPAANGLIEISTDYPDYFPVMKFARSTDVRRRLSLAFSTRAYPKNRDVLRQMMESRYGIAQIIGYPSWADYNAADKMARNGARIAEFIQQIDDASRPVAKRELALLLAEKRKSEPNAAEVYDFEGSYLTELVRRSSYDFDSQSVRPYFAYNRVKQGILDTAARVFHLSFKREEGAPAWDQSVETWDAFEDGKMIGRFYLDMHPRKGKFTHAEMMPVLDGVLDIQLPEAALICNFAKPTADDPGLMEYSDVVTFFHEFGHLVHWMVSGRQQWTGISGISMEGDFVEAPSQMLEEWMRSPQVLAGFAKNYRTGEPIPAELVAHMNRASAFNRGNDVMRQNYFSAVSYDIYKTKPQDVDLSAVWDTDERHYTFFVPIDGEQGYAAFGHLSGYSSAYYTYMWDKVIAEDFFGQFDAANLLSGDTSMRYRRQVLQPGGSESANDLVRTFLGRPQNIEAFKRWLSEEFAGVSAQIR